MSMALYTHIVKTKTEPVFLYNLVDIAPIYYEEPRHSLSRDSIDWTNSVIPPNMEKMTYHGYEHHVFVYEEHFDTFEFIVAMAGGTCKRIEK